MVSTPQRIDAAEKLPPSLPAPLVTSQAFSVVVPFYNEVESAASFLVELAESLRPLRGLGEVLLVDDGSTDGTAEVLAQAVGSSLGWRLLRQPENRGQAAALFRGMHAATTPVVVTLDGDGQNDPSEIQALLSLLEGCGADMVVGVRTQRNDSWVRRRMSTIANGVRRCFLRDGVTDTGCGLKAFRREVVDAFLPVRTLYSFMPALAVAAGFRVIEVPVRHRPRQAGQSKYGLGVMLWRPLLDMLGIWWFTNRRFTVGKQRSGDE